MIFHWIFIFFVHSSLLLLLLLLLPADFAWFCFQYVNIKFSLLFDDDNNNNNDENANSAYAYLCSVFNVQCSAVTIFVWMGKIHLFIIICLSKNEKQDTRYTHISFANYQLHMKSSFDDIKSRGSAYDIKRCLVQRNLLYLKYKQRQIIINNNNY